MGKKKRPHYRTIEKGDGYVVEIPINFDPEFPNDIPDSEFVNERKEENKI